MEVQIGNTLPFDAFQLSSDFFRTSVRPGLSDRGHDQKIDLKRAEDAHCTILYNTWVLLFKKDRVSSFESVRVSIANHFRYLSIDYVASSSPLDVAGYSEPPSMLPWSRKTALHLSITSLIRTCVRWISSVLPIDGFHVRVLGVRCSVDRSGTKGDDDREWMWVDNLLRCGVTVRFRRPLCDSLWIDATGREWNRAWLE